MKTRNKINFSDYSDCWLFLLFHFFVTLNKIVFVISTQSYLYAIQDFLSQSLDHIEIFLKEVFTRCGAELL